MIFYLDFTWDDMESEMKRSSDLQRSTFGENEPLLTEALDFLSFIEQEPDPNRCHNGLKQEDWDDIIKRFLKERYSLSLRDIDIMLADRIKPKYSLAFI